MIDLAGMRIIESYHMVIPDGTKSARRSWRERLLTRPWRPWKSHKTVTNYKPDPQLMPMPDMFGTPALVGHPETIRRLKARTKEQGLASRVG